MIQKNRDSNTVASLMAEGPMALYWSAAQGLLAQDFPEERSPQSSRGSDYVVQEGVAVLPISGILTPNMELLEEIFGWSTYSGVERRLGEIASDKNISAVVLDFDTPGGFVLGIDAAAQAIAACASVKPVHSLVNPLCASAGYWLASQSTSITATPGAEVGSIGVMQTAFSPVAADMDGMQRYEVRSSHAQAKNPDPATENGIEEIQSNLDLIEARFHAAVSVGRNIPPESLVQRLSASGDPESGGRVFDTSEALNRGLVDETMMKQAFYQRVLSQSPGKPRTSRIRSHRARAASAVAVATS